MGDRHSAKFGEQTVIGQLCRVAGRGGRIVFVLVQICSIVCRNHIYHIRLRQFARKRFAIQIKHAFVLRVRDGII